MERIKEILYDLYWANLDPETDEVAKNNIENASEEITTYLIGEVTNSEKTRLEDTDNENTYEEGYEQCLADVIELLKGEK